jgi:hypothetical protein
MAGTSVMRTKPPFQATEDERQLVAQMCAVGIPQQSIARVVGIDSKTLRKYFRSELDTSKIKANAKVGGTLFNKAINGDTTAAIFWAKTQMGWQERSHVELGGNVSITLRLNGVAPEN